MKSSSKSKKVSQNDPIQKTQRSERIARPRAGEEPTRHKTDFGDRHSGEAARSHRPWERVPDPKSVRVAEPMAAEPTLKGAALRKLRTTAIVNRSDDHTFSIESFSDARLGLLGPLVGVLQEKFGATNMTHIQRGAIPAILRGADVLLKARTGDM